MCLLLQLCLHAMYMHVYDYVTTVPKIRKSKISFVAIVSTGDVHTRVWLWHVRAVCFQVTCSPPWHQRAPVFSRRHNHLPWQPYPLSPWATAPRAHRPWGEARWAQIKKIFKKYILPESRKPHIWSWITSWVTKLINVHELESTKVVNIISEVESRNELRCWSTFMD